MQAVPFIIAAAGSVMEGNAASAEAGAEGDVAGINADLATSQAGQAEAAKRRSNRDFLARQRAAIAESGVGFNDTSTRLTQQSAIEAELDALNIRYEGVLRRQGFLAEQSMAKQRAKYARRAGYMRAASMLVAGGAQQYEANALKRQQMYDSIQPVTVTTPRLKRSG